MIVTADNRAYYTEWPPGSGQPFNRGRPLEDSDNLAGLHVEIVGPGVQRSFRAADLLPSGRSERFDVPDAGVISAVVTLTRESRVIARGIAHWALRENGRWELRVGREPVEPSQVDSAMTYPECHFFSFSGCVKSWAFQIQVPKPPAEVDLLFVDLIQHYCYHCPAPPGVVYDSNRRRRLVPVALSKTTRLRLHDPEGEDSGRRAWLHAKASTLGPEVSTAPDPSNWKPADIRNTWTSTVERR